MTDYLQIRFSEGSAVPSCCPAHTLLRTTTGADQLVVFGDGMEADRLTASWGQEITVQLGEMPLRLVL